MKIGWPCEQRAAYLSSVKFLPTCHQSQLPADLADMGRLGTLEGGVPVEVRMRVQATAEAFAISQLITEALTAIVRDHCPCGRRAHAARRLQPSEAALCGAI